MIAFLVCQILSAELSYQQHIPPQPPTFRTEVRGVYVDVFVTKDGRPVGGLQVEDFEIFDNGVPQNNIMLLEATDYPLSTVLLLDASASVQGRKLVQIKKAAYMFIDGLTSQDDIGIITFSTRYRLMQSLTATRELAHNSVDSITILGGATALLDGLYAATIHAESGTGRPLVVIFSDGDDNSSWLTMKELLKTAKTSEAVIYAVRATSGAGIYFGRTESQGASFIENAPDMHGRRVLAEIAQTTGGRLVSIESPVVLSETFAAILHEVRSRYLLFYEPKGPRVEGWHVLEVRLKRGKRGKVRARAGYFMK
jgi:Ca-activated chloride channel family protein